MLITGYRFSHEIMTCGLIERVCLLKNNTKIHNKLLSMQQYLNVNSFLGNYIPVVPDYCNIAESD